MLVERRRSWFGSSRVRAGLPALLVMALLTLIATRAWVGEDAFITFRTIDNFVDGHGLRWNVDERVQTYTHPLWLLIQIPVYACTRSVCATTTGVALVTSLATLTILALRFRRRPSVLLLGLALPLATSGSFLRFSTSGFENPLSHLLLAIFALTCLDSAKPGAAAWSRLVGVTALAATTRPDLALVCLPSLLGLAIAERGRLPWLRSAAGLSPLILWLGFSLFYYGFAFPNTAPAKLTSDIPATEYLAHGTRYALNLFLRDPVCFATLMLGIGIPLGRVALAGSEGRDRASMRAAGLALGAALYCLYVLRIGGDFVTGRLWTPPFVVAAILWAHWLERVGSRGGFFAPRRVAWALLAAGVVAAVHVSLSPALERLSVRGRIRALPGAYKWLDRDLQWRSSRMAVDFERIGRRHRALAQKTPDETYTAVFPTIGMAGMAAGPKVVVIDYYGLGDPLLARLPPVVTWIRRVGHIPRMVPPGYERARRTGSLEELPPSVREYYRPLREIVSGPLWSWRRIVEIVAFNLGAYDDHLEAYSALNESARRQAMERAAARRGAPP